MPQQNFDPTLFYAVKIAAKTTLKWKNHLFCCRIDILKLKNVIFTGKLVWANYLNMQKNLAHLATKIKKFLGAFLEPGPAAWNFF